MRSAAAAGTSSASSQLPLEPHQGRSAALSGTASATSQLAQRLFAAHGGAATHLQENDPSRWLRTGPPPRQCPRRWRTSASQSIAHHTGACPGSASFTTTYFCVPKHCTPAARVAQSNNVLSNANCLSTWSASGLLDLTSPGSSRSAANYLNKTGG